MMTFTGLFTPVLAKSFGFRCHHNRFRTFGSSSQEAGEVGVPF